LEETVTRYLSCGGENMRIISKRKELIQKHWTPIFLCDDGLEYFMSELSKMKNLTPASIRGRIYKNGLSHHSVLEPQAKLGHRIDGSKNCCHAEQRTAGTPEWQELKRKATTGRLPRNGYFDDLYFPCPAAATK